MKVTALSFKQGYYQRQNKHKVSNKTEISTSPIFKDFGDSHLLINKKLSTNSL